MNEISRKKQPFKINQPLRDYLRKHGRESQVPLRYEDLRNFREAITLYDKNGKDTFWETCFYAPDEFNELQEHLISIYASLKAGGIVHVMEHLYVERIDNCLYGNTLPFRIRVVNRMNDNFDYFYVKRADSSRIYGLELEHLLSPNRIGYLVYEDTLIEEHIAGIPGDVFQKQYFGQEGFNSLRLAKEFVKFNERCLFRLLGDMHSSNFVIQVTPDFEETHYRIRAIDFDQQSHEGKMRVYQPQFFKQNLPYVQLVMDRITIESIRQYQYEERAMMIGRMRAAKWPLHRLVDAMIPDHLATQENIILLRESLAEHHQSDRFLKAHNMGELLRCSLLHLLNHHKIS